MAHSPSRPFSEAFSELIRASVRMCASSTAGQGMLLSVRACVRAYASTRVPGHSGTGPKDELLLRSFLGRSLTRDVRVGTNNSDEQYDRSGLHYNRQRKVAARFRAPCLRRSILYTGHAQDSLSVSRACIYGPAWLTTRWISSGAHLAAPFTPITC